jgi:hypothetical protein
MILAWSCSSRLMPPIPSTNAKLQSVVGWSVSPRPTNFFTSDERLVHAGAAEQLRAFDRSPCEDHLAGLERLGLPGQGVADDQRQVPGLVLHVLDEVVKEQRIDNFSP